MATTTFHPPVRSGRTHPRHAGRVLNVLLIAVAIIGAGVLIWEVILEDHLIPKRWSAIDDGLLYRSGRLNASLVKRTLEHHDIEVIIDLSGVKTGDRDFDAEQAAAADLGIEILRFPLPGDGAGGIERYAEAIATMARCRAEGRPALVHCAAGSQRTGGVTACYRLLVEGRSPQFAYDEMRRHDWDPDRNTELVPFLNEHMGQLAARLVALGVIDEVPDPLPLLPR